MSYARFGQKARAFRNHRTHCQRCQKPLSDGEKRAKCATCRWCQRGRAIGYKRTIGISIMPNAKKQLEAAGSGESWWMEAPREAFTAFADRKLAKPTSGILLKQLTRDKAS